MRRGLARPGMVRVGAERLLQAGVLLLPLACWPNLPHPFSTPKTWLLGLLALCALAAMPPAASLPNRAGEWLWLLWPAALATTALTAGFPGFDALLLAALPLPLAWAIHRGAIPIAPLRRALVLGSAVESAIACLQYAGLDPLQWLGWQPESFTAARMRVYGTMGNPDFVAAWLCATLPLYAGVRGPALFGAALQLAAIFATGSRVFLLALPIAAFALWSHRLKENPWRTHSCVPRRVSLDALGRPAPPATSARAATTLAPIAILAAVAAAILYFSPARPLADTIRGRWYLTSVAVAHWREVPLTGLGPGSVEIHFAPWQAATRESRFAGPVDHIHNDYVEFWVEYGPVGLGAFLALSLWLVAGKPPVGDAGTRGRRSPRLYRRPRAHRLGGLPLSPTRRMGVVLDFAGGPEPRKKQTDRSISKLTMPNMTKRILSAGVVLLFALGLCRAAKFRFQDKEDALRKQAREQLATLGITRDAAKAKYPTPQIQMITKACMMPGETGEVVVKGKFPPGSNFIFQNDNLEVLKESQVPGEYRATLKAAAGIGPQSAAVLVMSPVTAITARQDNAAVIAGRYEWDMNAANGWRVVAQSSPGNSCATDSPAYDVQFFRKGEAAAFEKGKASLYHSIYEQSGYSFSISQQDAAAAGMGDFAALMQKFSDPKITGAQREALLKQVEKAQETMQASMAKMADPANIAKAQQKAQEFGCERISVGNQAGSLTGTMRCAEKVGTRIGITGTLKFLGR